MKFPAFIVKCGSHVFSGKIIAGGNLAPEKENN